LAEPAPVFDRRALTPYGIWRSLHEALIQAAPAGRYAAFHAGRISPEPYQFAPLARMLASPRRSLLIADDVGLGKTIEAGICLLELVARGVGKRVLLVVPPGLIPQWVDEMWEKFGLQFHSIENSAALDRAQTAVSEGLQPWAYFDRVITSLEYLKRRDVHAVALAYPWDAIVGTRTVSSNAMAVSIGTGRRARPSSDILFHPDSPEDRVLDRLVQRIGQMHDDRVSTPDILGILEGSRIEDVLGQIDSLEAAEAAGQSLVRLFDARERDFAYQIAPLLISGAEPASEMPFANAISADPLVEDDSGLERVMLDGLGASARLGRLDGTWRIDVPRRLQGPGVAPRYDCATFRRSVATQYAASDVEFIHRLHPLFRSVAAHALGELTTVGAHGVGGPRIALRRHRLAVHEPIALFTYLERQTHPAGSVFAIAIDAKDRLLEQSTADALLAGDDMPVGEVSWAECERAFATISPELQRAAARAAADRLRDGVAGLRAERERVARVLREEAALYRADRLTEIDAEEQAERAGSRDQMELFREAAVNWGARRAAVDTHYCKRLDGIEEFTRIPEPPEPQPLGALLVFPPA
jgi:hypothetical protein